MSSISRPFPAGPRKEGWGDSNPGQELCSQEEALSAPFPPAPGPSPCSPGCQDPWVTPSLPYEALRDPGPPYLLASPLSSRDPLNMTTTSTTPTPTPLTNSQEAKGVPQVPSASSTLMAWKCPWGGRGVEAGLRVPRRLPKDFLDSPPLSQHQRKLSNAPPPPTARVREKEEGGRKCWLALSHLSLE